MTLEEFALGIWYTDITVIFWVLIVWWVIFYGLPMIVDGVELWTRIKAKRRRRKGLT